MTHPLEFLSGYGDIGLLALRLAIGALMMVHGAPKLFNRQAREQMRPAFKGFGVPPALFDLVGLLEFFGGLALLLGLLTRVVSILFVLEMIGTILLYNSVLWKAPIPRGWVEPAFKATHGYFGGWELDTLILAGALTTALLGGGIISIDALLNL